jgi:hypothetical protein
MPPFYLELKCHPKDIINFLSTWSAVQRFKLDRGFDPIPEF